MYGVKGYILFRSFSYLDKLGGVFVHVIDDHISTYRIQPTALLFTSSFVL